MAITYSSFRLVIQGFDPAPTPFTQGIACTTTLEKPAITDGTGNDQIKILEDTDGDGRADKFTIFADKLSVPTSLTFWNDGVTPW